MLTDELITQLNDFVEENASVKGHSAAGNKLLLGDKLWLGLMNLTRIIAI